MSFEEALQLTIIRFVILGQGMPRGIMNQEIVSTDHHWGVLSLLIANYFVFITL